MKEWISSSGNIVLNIPDDVVSACTQSGDNEEAVKRGVAHKDMQGQLYALNPAEVAKCIKECFVDIEPIKLMDTHTNLERLLWMACWDIADSGEDCNVVRHWRAYGNKDIELFIPEEFVEGVAAMDGETLRDCMQSEELSLSLKNIDPSALDKELRDYYGYVMSGSHDENLKRIVIEACIELSEGNYPIPVGAIEVGSEVYWHDPDGGLSSGLYKVDEILSEDDGMIRISNGFSEAEVYFNELELK